MDKNTRPMRKDHNQAVQENAGDFHAPRLLIGARRPSEDFIANTVPRPKQQAQGNINEGEDSRFATLARQILEDRIANPVPREDTQKARRMIQDGDDPRLVVHAREILEVIIEKQVSRDEQQNLSIEDRLVEPLQNIIDRSRGEVDSSVVKRIMSLVISPPPRSQRSKSKSAPKRAKRKVSCAIFDARRKMIGEQNVSKEGGKEAMDMHPRNGLPVKLQHLLPAPPGPAQLAESFHALQTTNNQSIPRSPIHELSGAPSSSWDSDSESAQSVAASPELQSNDRKRRSESIESDEDDEEGGVSLLPITKARAKRPRTD